MSEDGKPVATGAKRHRRSSARTNPNRLEKALTDAVLQGAAGGVPPLLGGHPSLVGAGVGVLFGVAVALRQSWLLAKVEGRLPGDWEATPERIALLIGSLERVRSELSHERMDDLAAALTGALCVPPDEAESAATAMESMWQLSHEDLLVLALLWKRVVYRARGQRLARTVTTSLSAAELEAEYGHPIDPTPHLLRLAALGIVHNEVIADVDIGQPAYADMSTPISGIDTSQYCITSLGVRLIKLAAEGGWRRAEAPAPDGGT